MASEGVKWRMVKAVFLHRADSIYDDRPDTHYDFPRTYLRTVKRTTGDWIVYLEPVRAGSRGYFAVAKVQNVIEKPDEEGRFLALIEPGTFLLLDNYVPRLTEGRVWESLLGDAAGFPLKGGRQQLAVRELPEEDFARIVNEGLPQDLESLEARQYSEPNELSELPVVFQRPILERLTHRPYRDVAFRRKVRAAYGNRCAISGLSLRNGGGKPEVQAAHIRPVEENGSDDVRNGIALSGTLHWMFDRGLISVEPETFRILVSHNRVPADVAQRLIPTKQKIRLPHDRNNWPHPANLAWHRKNRFGHGQFVPAPSQ
ncbi:MAG: HNH endonuclease [Paracoccaceae bacterium]